MIRLKNLFNIHQGDDSRLVQLRSFTFALFAFISSLIALIIDLFLEMYTVALLVSMISAGLLAAIWFILNGKMRFFKLIVVVFFNAMLFVLSYVQGRETFVFLLYIPLIFCIPFILESKNNYTTELLLYVLITAACAFLSIFISPQEPIFMGINTTQHETLFLINACITISITVFFALSIIYSDRVFRDILNRKIDHAEMQNLLKNRFLSGTSHELRTAINGVTSAVYMMQSQAVNGSHDQHFRVLKYCSDHMINIVNEILDYDKIESGKLELYPRVFNIGRLLQDAPLPFLENMREKKLAFVPDIDKRLQDMYVSGDDFRIVQVINNLLCNAVKFTEHGQIALKAGLAEEDETTITCCISVSDTGIGIEQADIDKIFSGYWQVYNEKTLTNRGSGLGLSISKKLLELMESGFTVDSQPGKGSTFSFTLQLNKVSFAHIPDKKAPVQENSLEGLEILVAEDDPVNMQVAVKILEMKKARVHKAVNGLEVLKTLSEHNTIDFILMDLEMPLMNGYDAIMRIRESYPDLPVIAFTAAIMDKQFETNLKKSGFTECIAKPFKPETFFSKIRYVLEQQQAVTNR